MCYISLQVSREFCLEIEELFVPKRRHDVCLIIKVLVVIRVKLWVITKLTLAHSLH
jgi:hypothetical protein